MNTTMSKHCIFFCQIVDVGKFAIETSFQLLILCKLCLPIMGAKASSLCTSALESLDIYILDLGNLSSALSNSS
jgi:hypothetical protein